MANGIPVRLSEALASRARKAAAILDRSVTEQVEHWARLGQIVESLISAGAVERLKARSFDPDLAQRLAVADTPEGQAKALELIRQRSPVRYGLDAKGTVRAAERRPTKPSKRK